MTVYVQFVDGSEIVVARGLEPECASELVEELIERLCIPTTGFTDTYVWEVPDVPRL